MQALRCADPSDTPLTFPPEYAGTVAYHQGVTVAVTSVLQEVCRALQEIMHELAESATVCSNIFPCHMHAGGL